MKGYLSASFPKDSSSSDPIINVGNKKSKVHSKFKPSAIAIHPDGNIYVLSSFSKTLLVLSPDGFILNKVVLDEALFRQPEGITFNTKGDLFISNEKNKGAPTLLRFNYRHE